MSDITQRIRKLLKEDRRYKPDAYQFVQEALGYAQNTLEMGAAQPTVSEASSTDESPPEMDAETESLAGTDVVSAGVERHLTGQQLCEAIRQFALEQYGLMAKVVLNRWGIRTTSDFGDIVYNLISVGCMKKSKHDRREDFNDVYDFETAFSKGFQITRPPER
jgi:uncharacterized repeat protein (TIGR04138 family)